MRTRRARGSSHLIKRSGSNSFNRANCSPSHLSVRTEPSSHQLAVIMDQDEQQQFQLEDAYSASGTFGGWAPRHALAS